MKLVRRLAALCALCIATPAMAQTQPAGTTIASPLTVTSGGVFQTGAVANYARRGVDFQNKSGNGDKCYVYFGSDTATTAKAIKVLDGNGYTRTTGTVPNDQIQLTCDTAGDAFYLAVQ